MLVVNIAELLFGGTFNDKLLGANSYVTHDVTDITLPPFSGDSKIQ